jgi:ribosomal protein S18 acetylase RimI-like enzyme
MAVLKRSDFASCCAEVLMAGEAATATRVATLADAPAVARVINRAYRVEDFFIRGDRTNEAEVRMRLSTPDAGFLVIPSSDAAGELAAAVYFEVRGARGYFAMLSVDPAYQKRGFGRLLTGAVEAQCRARGCTCLDIEVVNLREELPAFYARLGFIADRVAPFPDPAKLTRDAHLVLMSKPLPGVD